MEMLHAITGASVVSCFGSNITGRDSFSISVEEKLKGLPTILQTAINKYESNLPTQFEWVDNINRIRCPDEIDILDMELVENLNNKIFDDIWLGEPEIVDWENQIGYSFDCKNNSPRHVTLQLNDYINHLGNQPISIEGLKNDSVYINKTEYMTIKKWSVYRCFYAEIEYDGTFYILRNGTWYKVNQDFVNTVDKYLESLNIHSYNFPLYQYDREEEYNEFVVKNDSSFSLMDKKIYI
jgi:uncharacterized protein (TIGR04141 family)